MTLFSLVVAPMPFKLKSKLTYFLAENPVVAKISYGVSWLYLFVAVLFVDSVQRMIKIAREGSEAKEERGVQDVRVETNYRSRKFYAQRNLYLTGFTLVMALLLTRAFMITFDLVKTHEELNKLGNSTAKNSASSRQTQDLQDEVAALKKKVQAKEVEIANVKKQAGQNATAYEELSGPNAIKATK
ncbi:hypothetical protein FFLO_04486 [Filobasidium floriforme]|uniref:Endoplasmic reticulum transmembrane protein n=1 Tax=Filobasidium floriforme TaxID=5210 RepID=A0A8K0JK26_9TREE|nr:hypothetical protein FFLO_04486 [Filobasidium floriforme]